MPKIFQFLKGSLASICQKFKGKYYSHSASNEANEIQLVTGWASPAGAENSMRERLYILVRGGQVLLGFPSTALQAETEQRSGLPTSCSSSCPQNGGVHGSQVRKLGGLY